MSKQEIILITADICQHGGSISLCEWCRYKAQIEICKQEVNRLRAEVRILRDALENEAKTLTAEAAVAVCGVLTSSEPEAFAEEAKAKAHAVWSRVREALAKAPIAEKEARRVQALEKVAKRACQLEDLLAEFGWNDQVIGETTQGLHEALSELDRIGREEDK